MNTFQELLTKANELVQTDRWYLPFPMGVFGTLRDGMCNNSLMHRGKVMEHRKAFMPHFIARGLSITFKEGSSAAFEVFYYDANEWQKMIPRVDGLEGFHPDYAHNKLYGYYRTLAWLRLLPEDFKHTLYNKDSWLGEVRDLRIPQDSWDKYETVPCWVYSSKNQNDLAKDSGTIIWG